MPREICLLALQLRSDHLPPLDMIGLDRKTDTGLCVTKQSNKKRSCRKPRPAPINTGGIRIANATSHIQNSDDRTPNAAKPIHSSRLSAQVTPQAIVTAIRWQSSSALRSSELAFSFSPTSPSYLDSALPSPKSPMESTCLPSGRVLKSPFSYTGSPYPFSPPPSASRLSPNTYRNIPRIDTNFRNDERVTPAERVMLTQASNQRMRQEHPQSAISPVDFSPTTPVTVEVGYPMVLDPVTPTIHTPGLAMLDRSNTLPSFRSPPGPVRTRARNNALKRGRDPYRQDSRGQGGVSQRTTSEPRLRSNEELSWAMGYGPGPEEVVSSNGNAFNRRQQQVDIDGYSQGSQRQQQSYASFVSLSDGTEDALRQQISRN